MDQPPAGEAVDVGALGSLCSLQDPNRRRMYDHVVSAGEPVTRDQVSEATGLGRSLVAYHLDHLVDEGLLAASFSRPAGRSGPGAGRPAKLYRRADREFAVSVPTRDYELVAEILARAVETDDSGSVASALGDAAAAIGEELRADDGESILETLARLGFEPYREGSTIRLRNCPFHRLARRHTELICGMNLALLGSLAESVAPRTRPRLEPDPRRCCVVFDAV